MRDLFRRAAPAEVSVLDMVPESLHARSLADLTQLLRSVAESLNAVGCVLWEVAPHADFDVTRPRGTLFALAQWFRGGAVWKRHNLPLDRSLAGAAVLTGRGIGVPNIDADPLVNRDEPFLGELEITRAFAEPIQFQNGTRGALKVYRTDAEPPFDNRGDPERIKRLAELVAALAEAVRDRQDLQLVRRISDELHKADSRVRQVSSADEDPASILGAVASMVKEAFNCFETSIFLADSLTTTNTFALRSTTWPWPEDLRGAAYEANAEGLTGWVLTNGRSVVLPDLTTAGGADAEWIQRVYPGLTPSDPLRIDDALRRSRGVSVETPGVPSSWMAAPIRADDRVLGAIRCCAVDEMPYVFSQRDLNLLEIVAAQVGHYWRNAILRRDVDAENRTWRELVAGLLHLNTLVEEELKKPEPDQEQIRSRALAVARDVVPHTIATDIRLLDPDRRELYFAQTDWPDSTDHDNGHREQYLDERFPVDGQADSVGARVFRSRTVELIDYTLDTNQFYRFPDVKALLVAPIVVGRDCLGVLDIRIGLSPEEVADHVRAVAHVLGLQLGLYVRLASTVGELHKSQQHLQQTLTQQTDIFKDLRHQLNSPILSAYRRVAGALIMANSAPQRTDLASELSKVRGLVSKAIRVATSTGVFADLAGGRTIPLGKSTLGHETIRKLLIEAADDQQFVVGRRKRVKVEVDRDSVGNLYWTPIIADMRLLEQAVSCVLDNAVKYSYPGETVRMHAGRVDQNRAYIAVTDTGIPMSATDAKLCRERGWRGAQARDVTGEGHGIGLWLVDGIMKAHGGELVVEPTNAEGTTTVSLVFPTSRLGSGA